MSYPPQRPPFEQMSSSQSYMSDPLSLSQSHHSHSAPLRSPYDPETPGPVMSNAPGHKLHRPSWMMAKESDLGYTELDNSRGQGGGGGYGQNEHGHRSDELLTVLPAGEESKTFIGQLYGYLVRVSIVTRWILFIVPILGIIWIPGILYLTTARHAKVWNVGLLWWSIWLTVIWGGWWGALATARVAPSVIRATVGVVAVSSRRYIDWLQALHRYVAFFAWAIAVWASFNPLIDIHVQGTKPSAIPIIAKLSFGVMLCAGILLFEKFSIQWIAGKFHERSYAERIADQKFAVRTLVTLYRHSTDIPGRTDTLGHGHIKEAAVNPRRLFKKLREGVRYATTTTATVFGNVASEIAGSSVLQPNSPQAVIKTVLESANKSRLLARRLFYSFAQPKSEYLVLEDIQRFFATREEAIQAFALFDKDANGDVSREELEMACLEFHREQQSIEHSMRDLDSAVGRLDNIFMSIYVIIAALVIAICLEAQVATLVTGAGTLILGLSWLIGGSLQEVLTSIIFLFIKHPFDVGDRVVMNSLTYTVKEIRLLSTVFLDSNSTLVQAPNNVLNTLFIQNIRRSPQMSETFTFDVSYGTSFQDLERLREKMLEFLKTERRDYQTNFDVRVVDFPGQTKMTLSADIKYKSNAQQAALKAQRRNKWICALKAILGELKIYGPSGDPNPPPAVTRYTEVPWDLIQAEDRKKARKDESQPVEDQRPPSGGWELGDKNTAILDNADDVFGDANGVSHGIRPKSFGHRDAHHVPLQLQTAKSGSNLSSLTTFRDGVQPAAVRGGSAQHSQHMPTRVVHPDSLPSQEAFEMRSRS
ncbi:hypothetical protein CVT26_013696 [Gymnopilus dilepis]|uniref:EF-hand domain-containing protein n=1 Tax=Gymnopilus dilepis TaxID=231916 RepID=A0A409YWL4_9AGAR|nr:hypothetical protein CVT26_013696 [Gymnopilus dilepis]